MGHSPEPLADNKATARKTMGLERAKAQVGFVA
jgi:hypothetical protein